MQNTGERQIATIPGTLEGIDVKHLRRYEWASSITRNQEVYDIASGSGYGAILLEAKKYTGFDNSSESIEFSNQHYKPNENIHFVLADACNMPEDLAPVDSIVSFETIEHLKDPEALLAWSKSHCKQLIISSPIRGSFGRSKFHLFEYRLNEFENVLKKYFSKVTMFIQRDNGEIVFPCLDSDKGVAVAICSN